MRTIYTLRSQAHLPGLSFVDEAEIDGEPYHLAEACDLHEARLRSDAALVVVSLPAVTPGVQSSIDKSKGAPVLIQYERPLAPGVAQWARENNIGLFPADLVNGFTVKSICEVVMNGRAFAPDFFGASFFPETEPGTAFVVLSLPRTGSKGLADHIALWSAGRFPVAHTHDISTDRYDRLMPKWSPAMGARKLLSAKLKLSKFHHLQTILDSDAPIEFLTVTRDTESRISSVLRLKGKTSEEAIIAERKKEAAWVIEQLGQFGIDLERWGTLGQSIHQFQHDNRG